MPVKLHHQTYGRGRPILILHGLFGSGRNWTAFAKQLAGRYRVITLDLRNHGNSGHADSMTYPEMAEDVHQFILNSGLDQTSIIGHSMGGKVAMTLALTDGSLIDQLVILDIAPVAYNSRFNSLLESMATLSLGEVTGRRHADELLAGVITDIPLRLFLLQNLVPGDKGYRWRINLNALKNSLNEISSFPAMDGDARHDGPTMFLGGRKSTYLLPDFSPGIRRYFTNVQIRYIDNAGHWLHIDQPDAVLAGISEFLGAG